MTTPQQSSTSKHALTQHKERQGYIVDGEVFPTKDALTERIHTILFSYELGAIVVPKDEALLLALLAHHPRAAEKIGAGVRRIRVKPNRLFGNTRYFWLERTDGTGLDFSYHKCIRPVSRWGEAMHAMRLAIQPQIVERKMRAFGGRAVIQCPVTDVRCGWEDMHVDHRPPLTFAQLAKDYLASQSLSAEQVVLIDARDFIGKTLGDVSFEEDWQYFHACFADLWVISIAAHVALTRQRLSLLQDVEEPCTQIP